MLLSLLEVHPFSFVTLIRPTLELTFYYLFTDEGVTFLFERFIIQCFNLIKNIFLCTEYKPAKVLEMTKHEETLQAYQTKQDFFRPETVSDMCRKLVGHYFILTKDELETWDDDPEGFCNDETGDSWKYSLRVRFFYSSFLLLFIKICTFLTFLNVGNVYVCLCVCIIPKKLNNDKTLKSNRRRRRLELIGFHQCGVAGTGPRREKRYRQTLLTTGVNNHLQFQKPVLLIWGRYLTPYHGVNQNLCHSSYQSNIYIKRWKIVAVRSRPQIRDVLSFATANSCSPLLLAMFVVFL